LQLEAVSLKSLSLLLMILDCCYSTEYILQFPRVPVLPGTQPMRSWRPLPLTRVELSAWQGIDLPRQWDNPDREPDPWPEAQLADLAGRVREALLVWEDCLGHLHSSVTD